MRTWVKWGARLPETVYAVDAMLLIVVEIVEHQTFSSSQTTYIARVDGKLISQATSGDSSAVIETFKRTPTRSNPEIRDRHDTRLEQSFKVRYYPVLSHVDEERVGLSPETWLGGFPQASTGRTISTRQSPLFECTLMFHIHVGTCQPIFSSILVHAFTPCSFPNIFSLGVGFLSPSSQSCRTKHLLI